MKVVKVPLQERSYRILVGRSLLSQLGAQCRRLKLGQRGVIVTDDRVGPRYARTVQDALMAYGYKVETIIIPHGETSKQWRVVQDCYNQLAAARLERSSFVVALGGGVVGDLAGFVAATYLRGVDFVQIPTTLLAQVDSSVGGKVGINLKAGKNLVGAFYQPKLVLCDLDTLKSLPKREFRAGMAEVIKYGIIWDAKLFQMLETQIKGILKLDLSLLEQVVARCCQIKAKVVGQDEKEGGLRAILNYGHTIGHAIEAITRYGTYLHGEAISVGQVAAGHLSEALTGLKTSEAKRIEALFKATGLPTRISLNQAQRKRLLEAMQLDKKVSQGQVKFVLATRLGKVSPGHSVETKAIHAALDSVQKN
jgi:3-dehydroquinate synthase